jgi:phenylpropionate dioxygenase-like ring-hydroxylating dioxygenase large terminal subunit
MKTETNGKRWAREYPELGTGPIPIEPCVSPEYFRLEQEKIFRRAWLNVGRVEEIPQVGDFFVRDLAVCRTSILVVRGKDSKVRGFHNMCSHRGNKLEWGRRGRCQGGVFTCKFHGWSYTTEGRLVGVPDEANFFDLDKAEHGLTPVATDVWEGFIFVNLDPQPKQTLREYLGGVVDALEGFPFDRLPFGYGYKGELNCNWKISVDSQQEAYHIYLHRRPLGDLRLSDNPFLHALDIKFFGPHRMISLPGNRAHKPTPTEALAHRFGWTIKNQTVAFLDPGRLPSGVNPTRSPDWFFDIYLIFPNFWIAVFDGAFQTHNFWPIAVDRMYQEIKMHVPLPRNAGECFSKEYAKCLNRDVWLEDFSTLENTQEMLGSGAKTHFILQDEEILIRHFYTVLEDHVRAQA